MYKIDLQVKTQINIYLLAVKRGQITIFDVSFQFIF